MTTNIVCVANQLWISYEKVRQIDSQFYDYVRDKVYRKAMELRVIGGKKYILYDEKLKTHREKLGKREDLLAEMEKEQANKELNSHELAKLNFAASIVSKRSLYAELIKDKLTDLEAMQMMRLCGWFDRLEKEDFAKYHLDWTAILEMMQQEWRENRLYGKSVESVGGLKTKLHTYLTAGWQGLVDGRKGNTNNAKLQAWHQAIIYRLYTESKAKLLVPTLYKSFCVTALDVLLKMDLKVQAKLNFRGQVLDNNSRAMGENSLYTKLEYINKQTGEVIQVGDLVYDKLAGKFVYQPCDFETVRRYVTDKDFRVQADSFRHGGKYFNDTYNPFSRLALPKHSLSLVTMDDYVNNFYLLKVKPNGTMLATTDRLRSFTIWDTATDIPLGSAHGLGYNKQLVFRAIYEAMLFIKAQTGKWIAPCEVEMERMFTQGSKKVTGLQDGQDKKVTGLQDGQDKKVTGLQDGQDKKVTGLQDGQDKKGRVESAFELDLQKLFMFTTLRQTPQAKLTESRQNIAQNEFFRDLEWYLGNNITSTKEDSKVNAEKRKAKLNQCVTEQQVADKWSEYRDFKCKQLHPNGQGKTRLEYFKENLQSKCQEVSELEMVQIFAKHLGCVTTVAERRCELLIKGKIYEIPVGLLNKETMRSHLPSDGLYAVKYLPHNLSMIYIFNPTTGIYLGECAEKQVAQRAKVEQTEVDKEIIGHGRAELARLKKQIAEAKKKHEATLQAFEMEEILRTNSPVRTWQTSRLEVPEEVQNTNIPNEGIFGEQEPTYEFLND
jgi:hypothetical protein